MSNPSEDKRIIKTRQLIRKAFTNLMEEKGFNEITVRDLTERAVISRGTFYLHYRDKFDLLEQSENEIFQDLLEIVQKHSPLDLTTMRLREEFAEEFACKLFTYLAENAELIRLLLSPKGHPMFQVKFKEVIKNNIWLIHKSDPSFLEQNLQVPLDYLLAYLTSAHLGVIQQWLQGGLKETPEQMANTLMRMTLLGPLHAAGFR